MSVLHGQMHIEPVLERTEALARRHLHGVVSSSQAGA
jgi:hypothetical protein